MADKTKFVSTKTIVRADFANKIFGGLANSDEATFLDPSDPLVAGHVHDGQNLDGHAQRIDLEDHVTGELDGARLQDGTVTEDKLAFVPGGDSNPPVSLISQNESLALLLGSPGFPVATSKTLEFGPVTEDILLKRLVFTHIADQFRDQSIAMYISSITVGGGANLLTGQIPIAMFTHDRGTRLTVPELDIPVSTGQTVEVVVENLSANGSFIFMSWTYAPNTGGETQKRDILGMPSVGIIPAATKPSASITVNAIPLSVGDKLIFSSILADTPVEMTAVSGPRTPGGNNFSIDFFSDGITAILTTADMAQEIKEAIGDTANDPVEDGFVDSDTISVLGSTVTFEPAQSGGSIYEIVNSVSATLTTPANLTISDYTGGVDGTVTVSMSVPTRDLELNNLFVSMVFGDEGGDFQRTALIDEIRVNGTNILMGSLNASFVGIDDQLIVPNLGEDAPASSTIEFDLRSTWHELVGVLIGWAATIQ